MPRLLVLHHSPTKRLAQLLDDVLDGARHEAITGVEVSVVEALDATVDDFLTADAMLFGTPANFGYISGALKHSFDATYDDVRDHTAGRPYSFWIHGKSDTTGARRALESLAAGLTLRLAAEPVEIVRPATAAQREALTELGGTMAALLMG